MGGFKPSLFDERIIIANMFTQHRALVKEQFGPPDLAAPTRPVMFLPPGDTSMTSPSSCVATQRNYSLWDM